MLDGEVIMPRWVWWWRRGPGHPGRGLVAELNQADVSDLFVAASAVRDLVRERDDLPTGAVGLLLGMEGRFYATAADKAQRAAEAAAPLEERS